MSRPKMCTFAIACNYLRPIMIANLKEDSAGNLHATLPWITNLDMAAVSNQYDYQQSVANDILAAYTPRTMASPNNPISMLKSEMDLLKAAYVTYYGVQHMLQVCEII